MVQYICFYLNQLEWILFSATEQWLIVSATVYAGIGNKMVTGALLRVVLVYWLGEKARLYGAENLDRFRKNKHHWL